MNNSSVSTIIAPISLDLLIARASMRLPCVVSRTLSGLKLTVGRPLAGIEEQQAIDSEQRTIDRKQLVKASKVNKVRSASKSAKLLFSFFQNVLLCPTVVMPMSIAYLDTSGAAAYLGLSKNTLEKWRIAGQGPAYIRLGLKKVRYDPADLDEWRDGRRQTPRPLDGAEARH